jgi:DNA-binding CsgD family transcriptional regulator
MRKEIQLLHDAWEEVVAKKTQRAMYSELNFDELISALFTMGPFYFYVADHSDKRISKISRGFTKAHGIDESRIKTLDDLRKLIHPEDLSFVNKAEKQSLKYLETEIGKEKIFEYKPCFYFRTKTPNGNYKLYNHQSVVLAVNENYEILRTVNIHVDFSHIIKKNNFKFSLIALNGDDSYLNIDPYAENLRADRTADKKTNALSKRELEVIRLMTQGKESKAIAKQLHISEDTVKCHRKNALKKTKTRNAAQLIAKSIREGWL